MQCLWLILFNVILQQIDGNIIGPNILETTKGISEFWVTFALLLFGGIFGFVGMIIGVPLFAVIYYLCKNFINSRTARRGLPIQSELYLNVDKIDEETLEFIPFQRQEAEQKKKKSKKP